MLLKAVKKDNKKRLSFYRQMAAMHYNGDEGSSE
jgi:hypothetical protein